MFLDTKPTKMMKRGGEGGPTSERDPRAQIPLLRGLLLFPPAQTAEAHHRPTTETQEIIFTALQEPKHGIKRASAVMHHIKKKESLK